MESGLAELYKRKKGGLKSPPNNYFRYQKNYLLNPKNYFLFLNPKKLATAAIAVDIPATGAAETAPVLGSPLPHAPD